MTPGGAGASVRVSSALNCETPSTRKVAAITTAAVPLLVCRAPLPVSALDAPRPHPIEARVEREGAELQGLKLSALRRRADAEGADEDAIDSADDAEDSKAAFITLITGLVKV